MTNVALASAVIFGGTILSVSDQARTGVIVTTSEPASLVIFGLSLLALALLARRAPRRD